MSSLANIAVGAKGEQRVAVIHELTVQHGHPTMPAVYGTPYMILLMEEAASNAIVAALPPGWVSVGVGVHVEHLSATPIGRTVTASAVVTEVGDKLIGFDVEAHDGKRLIGKGTHTRAPVELERFVRRLAADLS